MDPKILIVACFAGFAILEMWRTGFWKKPDTVPGDGWIDLICGVTLTGLIQPGVLFLSIMLFGWVWPDGKDMFVATPLVLQFLAFLIFDDLSQYWWHRLSHTFPVLYNLHRPHHNAQYMSVRIVYRNNLFYYMMMPGLWLSGLLVYVGFGWIYALYIVLKMAVIIGAHSDVAWDKPLYKIKWLSPIMWVVERTISTPSTHSMHHGRHKSDGITHYKGNFGNFLFFWDVLFGSAKISRTRPPQYGVENLPKIGVAQQLLWPVFRSVKGAAIETKQSDKA